MVFIMSKQTQHPGQLLNIKRRKDEAVLFALWLIKEENMLSCLKKKKKKNCNIKLLIYQILSKK